MVPIPEPSCIALGLLGVILPVIPGFPFFIIASYCLSRGSPRIHRWMIGLPLIGDYLRKFEEMNLPPEFYEEINKLSNEYNQYGYSPTMTIIALAMHLVLFPLFGALGGMIGVSVFKKKNVTSQ